MIIPENAYPDLASIRELQAQEAEFSIFVHAGSVRSLEQAASERGQIPEQVVRSLVFRLAEDRFAMILAAGAAKLPWKKLRAHFGQRRLSQASPEEVLRVTGYEVGTVSPFGLARDLPIHIEEGVLKQDTLSMGSGRAGTALLMSSAQLQAALPAAQHIAVFED